MDNGQEELKTVLSARTMRERSDRARELVSMAFDAVKRTRSEQLLSREFLAGRVSPIYPTGVREAFAKSGRREISYRSPQERAIPLKLIGTLSDRWPAPQRTIIGFGRESTSVSTRIERLAAGVMYEQWPYAQSCDLVAIDGEAAGTVLPSVAHWAPPTDQYEYISPDEWAQVPDEMRELWEWQPGGAEGRYRRYSRKYRRDAAGLPEWDDAHQGDDGQPAGTFREDTAASAAAVADAIEQRVQAKIPLEQRLWQAELFAPINPRFVGDEVRVSGLAMREQMSTTELFKAGYRWAKNPGPGIVAAETPVGTDVMTLDTLILEDEDGRPYLIYSVEGYKTWRQGDNGDFSETVDLYDAYGIDFNPVAYQYGLHFATSNIDDRVVPYMSPLIGGLLARDKLMTVTSWHTDQTAWGGWFYKPDPALIAASPNLSTPDKITVEMGKVTKVPGDITSTIHPGAGPSVQILKAMIDSDLEAAGINPAAMGGTGATGVTDRAMIQRDEKRGLSMVWGGIDKLFGQQASNCNRMLACLARERGENITLNLLTEVPGEQTGKSATKRSTVVVDPDMFGGEYRVEATRAVKFGDDPATFAQAVQGWKDGVLTFSYVADAIGHPDSWMLLSQVFAEQELVNSEEGKKAILEAAAKMNADLSELKKAELRQEQLLNAQNVPTGMAAGVQQAPPQNSGQPLVTMDATPGAGGGMPGQNALNAQVGAANGTAQISRIAGIGGDASGLSPGGGGLG